MRIQSTLSQKAYLSALKNRMGNRFSFGEERFTGYFLGPLFSVTYHSGREWNRRITNEKNSAIGFVRKTEQGCEVRCIRTKGLLYPSGFLMTFALYVLVLLISFLGDSFREWEAVPMLLAAGLVMTVIVTVFEAFFESFTEQSYVGAKILHATLIDPSDPFSYLNHQKEII